jgi:5-methyltetrahydropteroyltriglutamate--homocysteine methyltransferase
MTQAATNLDSLRVDQIGSLLRPQQLKDTFERRARGEATDEELGKVEDEAIREAIQRQESLGFPVVTDGEFRRLRFQESFGESVSGFAATRDRYAYFETLAPSVTPLTKEETTAKAEGPPMQARLPVKERLRLVRNVPLEEYRFASQIAKRPVKVTLVCADRISRNVDLARSNGIYKDIEELAAEVIGIERQIISGLVEAGCKYIQIDAPSYTEYVDPPSMEQMRARGEDPQAVLERAIRWDNAVIEGFTSVTFGIHICRGNTRSMWHREGTYDAISEQLFNGLNHQRLLLEYDSDRAGSFEPLRFVPKGKIAVLGLVTTKAPEVESVDDLSQRLDEAARYLPIDQLALSPQCGFASSMAGNLLSEDDQWNKFASIVETAKKVWGSVEG